MDLEINNQASDFFVTEAFLATIKRAISTVLSEEKIKNYCNVSLSFVSETEIQALNRDFRKIDRVTDVLSFPMNEKIGEYLLLGDIIICVDRAKEQAVEYGHSMERELVYLIVHSTLHLLGYDHMTDAEKNEMRKKEKQIMNSLGIYKP